MHAKSYYIISYLNEIDHNQTESEDKEVVK